MPEEKSKSALSEKERKTPETAPDEIEKPDVDNVEQQLEKARLEAAENLENFLRAKAETENIQRRSLEEITKARKFAIEQFAGDLLAVHDSLELASQVDSEGEKSPVITQMFEGVILTLKQLDSAFEKAAITVIDPAGEKFNPELHQAMSMVESDEMAPNHVLSVLQKGYRIEQRLLRPAMVVVAKATSTTADTDEKTDGAEA
ncbi:MAG: nucleotide exchange factor GrpE [Acidiferrobacterales bacterium]